MAEKQHELNQGVASLAVGYINKIIIYHVLHQSNHEVLLLLMMVLVHFVFLEMVFIKGLGMNMLMPLALSETIFQCIYVGILKSFGHLCCLLFQLVIVLFPGL